MEMVGDGGGTGTNKSAVATDGTKRKSKQGVMHNRLALKNRRTLPTVLLFASLLSGAVSLALTSGHFSRPETVATPISRAGVPVNRSIQSAITANVLQPQASAQFDLSRNVIAGGGG